MLHRRSMISLGGLGFVFAVYGAFALFNQPPEVHAVDFTVEETYREERDIMNRTEPFLIIQTTDGDTYELKNYDDWFLNNGERWTAEVWEPDGQIMKYPRISARTMQRVKDLDE